MAIPTLQVSTVQICIHGLQMIPQQRTSVGPYAITNGVTMMAIPMETTTPLMLGIAMPSQKISPNTQILTKMAMATTSVDTIPMPA